MHEESPEQVLARLTRYRDSLVRTSGLPNPPGYLSARDVWAIVGGPAVLAVPCVVAIVSFAAVDPALGFVVVLATVGSGVMGAARQVPFARWWMSGGLVAGGLLTLAFLAR